MLASSKHVELANFIALSVLCVCNIYIFVKLVVVLQHNYDVCNQSNWHHFFFETVQSKKDVRLPSCTTSGRTVFLTTKKVVSFFN